ncbi:MAG: endonuclease/exonuclease/phosphatase family protein [Streptosporangiaceae bacterium]
MIGHENVWLGRAPGDMGRRAAQITEIGVGARSVVRVVNVHVTHRLRYGPGQLRCLLRAIDAGHTPTVIAGDFNMSRPMIYLARSYRPAVRGRTWPAKCPVVQLDHVLVSQGIRVVDRQVVHAAGSDHLPVRVALRVARGHAA